MDMRPKYIKKTKYHSRGHLKWENKTVDFDEYHWMRIISISLTQ